MFDMDLPTLPPGYVPSDAEDYMCPSHLAFFRKELEKWKQSLLDQAGQGLRGAVTVSRDTFGQVK